MKRIQPALSSLFFGLMGCFPALTQTVSVQSVPFNQVMIEDHFWAPRLEAHAGKTLDRYGKA